MILARYDEGQCPGTDVVQGLESTLWAVWAGHHCPGGCSVCGGHTLTVDTVTTETIALSTS